MHYAKLLLLTVSILFSYISTASNIKTLELNTMNGTQLVQIDEKGEVLLPQQLLSKIGAEISVANRYSRDISNIKKYGEKFAYIGTSNIASENIEEVCKNFLLNNKSKLNNININDLRLKKAEFLNNRWYVLFVQTWNGYADVFSSEVRFTVFPNGNIQTFKTTYYDDLPDEFSYLPTEQRVEIINKSAVLGLGKNIENYTINVELEKTLPSAISRDGQIFISKKNINKIQDKIEHSELLVIPVLSNGQFEYRLANKVEVLSATENYTAFVDASNGALLIRYNNISNSFAKGTSLTSNPKSPAEMQVMRNAKFKINNTEYQTDRNGDFPTPPPSNASYTTNLEGRYARMLLTDNLSKTGSLNLTSYPAYEYSGTTDDNGNIYMQGTEGDNDEVVRSLYYHVNRVHDYFKNIDISFNKLDFAFPCVVELLPEVDKNKAYDATTSVGGKIVFNAFSSGDRCIAFYAANHNKVFIGRYAPVLYHEYGHSVNYVIYKEFSPDYRMVNTTVNEAIADITAAFLERTSDIFAHCTEPGWEKYSVNRNVDNSLRFPENIVNASHDDGQILSGALWDLSKSIGLDYAEVATHFAKYEVPDGYTLEDAFSNWFEAVLKASDEGGKTFDIFDEILNAFDKHGIGFNLLAKTRFKHENIEDIKELNKTISIAATIPELYVPTQVSEVWVNYYTNFDSEIQSIQLTQNNETFSGNIPSFDKPSRMYYYFTFKNPYSGEIVRTPRDYMAFIGYEKLYENTCEAVSGWLVENDNNTEQGWSNTTPKLVYTDKEGLIDPGYDHTSGSGKCWKTGFNMYQGTTLKSNSKLTSSSLTFSNATYPVLSYYYYLISTTVYGGSLTLDISYDGGQTWATAKKYSGISSPKGWNWERDYIHLNSFKKAGEDFSNIKLRFSVFGNPASGIFYILLDDIQVFDTNEPGAISANNTINNIILSPNPASGEVRVTFDETLLNPEFVIIDVLGREVSKTSKVGALDNSTLNVQQLGTGTYFLQIKTNNKTTKNTILNIVN